MIDKGLFLDTLTQELLKPGKAIMDALVPPYARSGVLSVEVTASRLKVNFKREQTTSADEDSSL